MPWRLVNIQLNVDFDQKFNSIKSRISLPGFYRLSVTISILFLVYFNQWVRETYTNLQPNKHTALLVSIPVTVVRGGVFSY